MITNLKRIVRFGWQSALRNKGLSLQVVFIMSFAVLVFTSLFIFRDLGNFLIAEAEKRVDVSVYFKKEALEEDILVVKKELSDFSEEVEEVSYVSKEEAREIFLEKHKDDPLYLNALEEVGDNPFLPSLNIKSKNPLFYAQVSEFLTEGPYKNLVEKVSYFQNKAVIDKLFALVSNIKKAGIIFGLLLIVLVFLITFNTVKLTIFALREEIATMRLVGASNWFIRGPFLIQGVLYGIASIFVIDVLFFLFFEFFSSGLQMWFFNFDFLNHFQQNFLLLFVCQIVFAVLVGLLSSFWAVKKYLKV